MKTDVINILKTLIKEINTLVPLIDSKVNIDTISSHKDFYFSRCNEKLVSSIFNYMRLDILNQKITCSGIESIIKDNHNLEYLEKESLIDLTSAILRPTLELFLELKIIYIGAKINIKNKDNFIEKSCYASNLINKYQLNKQVLQNCSSFYECKPKYLKEYITQFKAPVEEIRTSLNNKNIILFSNYEKKIKFVLDNSNEYEKLILGKDYLTLYGFLSKRIHFSKDTNFTKSQFPVKHYLNWIVAFSLEIFELIFWFYDKEFKIDMQIDEQLKILKEVNYIKNINNIYSINDIVILEFGIAKIKEINDSTVKIIYIYTNCLKIDDIDDIDDVPITFIQKLNLNKYEEIVLNYSSILNISIEELNNQLLITNKYEEFWLSLKKHTNKTQEEEQVNSAKISNF